MKKSILFTVKKFGLKVVIVVKIKIIKIICTLLAFSLSKKMCFVLYCGNNMILGKR